MAPAPTNPAASLPAGLRLRRQSRLRARATRGDSAAFAVLFERHHQELYRFCRSILRHEEDARDAVQSAMTRPTQRCRPRSATSSCARGCSGSPTTRRSRSCGHAAADLDAVADAGEDSLLQTVADRERLAELRPTCSTCPSASARRWSCASSAASSHDEIAGVLASTPRSVKQTIFEARAALHECAEGRAMAVRRSSAPCRTATAASCAPAGCAPT